jgi:hypothetical protein
VVLKLLLWIVTNVYGLLDVKPVRLFAFRAEGEAQIGLAIFGVVLTFGL